MAAPEAIAWLHPCPFCNGRDASCTHCGADHRGVPVFRCPHATVTTHHMELVNAALLAQQGVMQDPGGWQDQSHTFTQAFPLLCREIAHWRSVAVEASVERAKQKHGKR